MWFLNVSLHCTAFYYYYICTYVYLAGIVVVGNEHVPGCQVAVDEELSGEVEHAKGDLAREAQQSRAQLCWDALSRAVMIIRLQIKTKCVYS